MATQPYSAARRRGAPDSIGRVLEAADRLINDNAFHTATMDDLARAAGCSRATVFNRFGSKLGVLEALFTHVMEGEKGQAVYQALRLEDPVAALDAVVSAACSFWDAQGSIAEHLQAIVALEPGATTLVDQHRESQRADLQQLARRLARAGALRSGLSESRAAATLHMLTSLESFLWLRRAYGLSIRQTSTSLTELARTVLHVESTGRR